MITVRNPILPGFNPDPCIIRVGQYYYIATSTFEWWPGVRIHRSTDLAHWDLVGHALTKRSQIDLRGIPDSGGVWAPGLSYADGKFWLVYSDVKAHCGPFKDVANYLITAEDPAGPWSEPAFLNRSGFDPSLFHDTDGRKWLVNQVWKTLPIEEAFAGIVLQEYSSTADRLIGDPVTLFRGTSLGLTEGPHLYKKDGYYYLVTAEGGTEWDHAVTVARSRSLAGPYEVSPHHPLLTSARSPSLPLQKAGHGSFVQSSEGDWYLAHLCSRHGKRKRCILGRETAIQPIAWPENDWPRLARGGNEPATDFTVSVTQGGFSAATFTDDFARPELHPQWNTLREPHDPTWLSLTERPGFLRLRGRNWPQCLFDQSLLGLRLTHPQCEVSTQLEFAPRTFQQAAGLAIYYNTANFYYLYLTCLSNGSLVLRLIASDNRRCREVSTEPIAESARKGLQLRARLLDEELQFYAAAGDGPERAIGPVLDASILSDDYPAESGIGLTFTGVFAALCAQNSGAGDVPADFDRFSYRAIETADNQSSGKSR
jgi:xylan 1,4-beta-xylosidase